MTPEERAVIEAARALEPALSMLAEDAYYNGSGELVAYSRGVRALHAGALTLLAAVRALPRPLSERLAELRPGAVVATERVPRFEVLANSTKHRCMFCFSPVFDFPKSVPYHDITRIISNPESPDA